VVILFIVLAPSVRADGIIIIEPRPDYPKPVPLAIKYHRVSVSIQDQVATTEVDQVFKNEQNRDLEGTYIFPMPEGAAIGKFEMEIDGKMVEGKIMDKDKARQIYEDIVRRMKDPALLEYVGRNIFKARVYPIPARGEKRIRLKYSEILKKEGDVVKYLYPLNTEKFSSRPLEECTVSVKIESQTPIKSVYCPTHKMAIKKTDENHARASYEESNVKPDKDVILYYTLSEKDFGLSLLSYREKGEKDGYFLILASPKEKVSGTEVLPKDVIFVLDTSGSMMDGNKLKSAKKALNFCLENLGKKDRFNIITFSDDVTALASELMTVTEENLKKAAEFIGDAKPMGGTNIKDAIIESLRLFGKSRSAYLIFLTDGVPTVGDTDVKEILSGVKRANSSARIFPFGVGDDVNVILLDQLGTQNRGVTDYMKPGEDIEIKLSSFFTKIAEPILSDVALSFEGVKAEAMYPKSIPDIFKGTQLVITGKYRGEGSAVIRLKGHKGDGEVTYTYEVKFPEEEEDTTFIPRLWATRRIGYLLEEIRLKGEERELVDEIVRLSREYGIMTPYTSFLVTEPAGKPDGRRDEEDYRVPTHAAPGDSTAAESPYSSSAPASGAGAVRASKEAGKMKEGEAPATARSEKVKSVDRKTFYFRNNTWVDADYKSQRLVEVRFGSDEYFELLRSHPKLAKYFAVGDSVIVVYQDKAYKVTP
jgi:Ca-activated chloride channel family protein